MTKRSFLFIPAVLLAMCLGAGGFTGHVVAAGNTGGGVVLTPSDAQGTPIDSPGYFQVSGAPGSDVALYALVGNIQASTAHVSMAAVDATSGIYGGISYNLPQQPRKEVGAWVTLSSAAFTLPSRKAKVVDIALHIPASATAGQYVGGLTAYVPAAKGSASLVVQLRRVVAIVVTVTGGPMFGRFTVGSIRAKHRPDATYVVAHIHNTGTILLKGQGHLWIWRSGVKRPVISTAITLDTTVPHTTVNYPVLLARRPARGKYTAKLTLTWDGGTATQTGTFSIRK